MVSYLGACLLFAAGFAISSAQLSAVNTCLKEAKAIPGNSLNGRTLAGVVGYGWDDLQSVVTKPVFLEEFKTCQAEPTGAYLLPDNVVATPILKTSLDKMAEYYESFDDYKQTITDSFSTSGGGGYSMFQASGSFSVEHQESKESFVRYKSSLLLTKLLYRSFNLYRDPVSALEPGFIDRIEQISNSISRNLTYQAIHFAEMVVKDYGTHYISTAETGAIIEQETFVDSKMSTTYSATMENLRASAAASFGSYFHATATDTHEVSDSDKKTLSEITKHSRISTNGGPDVNSILSMSDNGTLQIDNLVSFNHEGDWLYEIVVPRNFPQINSDIILRAQVLLQTAIELYYKKNTIRGCTDMNAENYNFKANVDDGTCKPNNDSYPFGGVYQICTPLDGSPDWRCDNFTQDNLFVGGAMCDNSLFEPVKLLSEIYHFEDRVVTQTRQDCHKHWFHKKCHDVNYDVVYKDSVNVDAFWCRKKADVQLLAEKGAMFGGVYEAGKINEFTGEAGCPGTFQSYRLGRNIFVCISYQYEQDHDFSVPVEKFFSCQTPAKEQTCSANFTQHLAAVENNCDVFFCLRRHTANEFQHPVLQRPPFTMPILAASNYSEHTIRAIYKGVELFSTPVRMLLEDTIITSNTGNVSPQVHIDAYIDEVHEKVLIVSNNLTASAAETLANIQLYDPDDLS